MRLLFCCLFLIPLTICAQLPIVEEEFIRRFRPDGTLPEDLLTTRTAVFYDHGMKSLELDQIQQHFQRSGVDAVAWFQSDLLTAGRDVAMALAGYLNGREISNLVVVQKRENKFRLYVSKYNRMANFVNENAPTWWAETGSIDALMQELYRSSALNLERENFLINDVPEKDLTINPIRGRRSEFFSMDLSIDALAVPKFGDEEKDRQLEEIMKMYPYKYALTDPNLPESELRKMGYFYVLRFVHTRARLAKSILGYDVAAAQSAIVSIAYPDDQPEVKNIAADTPVFKFYFKHIDSGNTFLGTKWDADITWEQALVNHLKGLRIELRIR